MDLGGTWQATPSTDERRRSITAGRVGPTDGQAGDRVDRPGRVDRLDRLDRSGPGDGAAWSAIEVPGHWRNHPDLAGSDGPVLYRREFSLAPPDPDQRVFLTLDGIFYQGDVWLDGEYLGDTEGYFAPHSFEVGPQLRARADHVLHVEVSCNRPSDLAAKRNLTGVFQHWDCIDPDWNPGGIWSAVHLERSGPVRIESLKVLCREATDERAVLDLEAVLLPTEPGPVRIRTDVHLEHETAAAAGHDQDKTLAAGVNTVRWRVAVERPQLWWPRGLGAQPLYLVEVGVHAGDGTRSDSRRAVTGLRQVRMRDFVVTVNGERLFLKGANLGPTRRDPAAATPSEVRADVDLAAAAGLDLLRVHAHIGRPELYDQADRTGMLLWQDLPLQWGYGRVRRQAVSQARSAVTLLGHHPSIAVWCGHNEPVAHQPTPGGAVSRRQVARLVAAQVLPTWNKTGLDRSIRRALEQADDSRPVVAHSGVLPHPLWGTDSHFYFGWYHGDERDFPSALARLPVLARFVSEFGAQSVPASAGFMAPEGWPDLDWEHLAAHHCLQKERFDQRIPPTAHPTFESWREATQAYQAELLRHHIETLRRLKYRPTGGFCFFLLADAQPAVSWSVLDHERVPKAGYDAVRRACAPVIVVADRLPAAAGPGERLALDVHVVNDLRAALDDARAEAHLEWPGGSRTWRFAGGVAADRCALIGRLAVTLPDDCRAGPLTLDLRLRWDGGEVANRYETVVTMNGRK